MFIEVFVSMVGKDMCFKIVVFIKFNRGVVIFVKIMGSVNVNRWEWLLKKECWVSWVGDINDFSRG